MMVTLASRLFGLLGLMLLIGCATRPVNPPIARVDPEAGYRFLTRQHYFRDHDTLVVLAFQGAERGPLPFPMACRRYCEIQRSSGQTTRRDACSTKSMW